MYIVVMNDVMRKYAHTQYRLKEMLLQLYSCGEQQEMMPHCHTSHHRSPFRCCTSILAVCMFLGSKESSLCSMKICTQAAVFTEDAVFHDTFDF